MHERKKKISIIVPCHNEEANIPHLYAALREMMNENECYTWEIVLVDDGSTDGTLAALRRCNNYDARVRYISLSRNFGKECAMLAGFDSVTGDCAVVMDADLQHPPRLIPDMIKLWEQGYDDVYARRRTRGRECWLRRVASLTYYNMLQRMAKTDVLPNVGDFRLLDRRCIDSLRQLRETQRYTKGLYCWIGFNKTSIDFDQGDRTLGRSSFKVMRLVDLAIEGVTSYTTAPLRISTIMGIVVSAAAFLYMLYVLLKTIIVGEPVQGFPTIIIVVLFLGGLQLLSLGILGEYIGRIFHETKHRPPYLIKDKSE